MVNVRGGHKMQEEKRYVIKRDELKLYTHLDAVERRWLTLESNGHVVTHLFPVGLSVGLRNALNYIAFRCKIRGTKSNIYRSVRASFLDVEIYIETILSLVEHVFHHTEGLLDYGGWIRFVEDYDDNMSNILRNLKIDKSVDKAFFNNPDKGHNTAVFTNYSRNPVIAHSAVRSYLSSKRSHLVTKEDILKSLIWTRPETKVQDNA